MDPIVIAQNIYMVLLALVTLAVIGVMILFIVARSRPEREPPERLVRKLCQGHRRGAACNKKLYICDNCKEVGCEMTGCTERCFKKQSCLRCETSNSREDYFPGEYA